LKAKKYLNRCQAIPFLETGFRGENMRKELIIAGLVLSILLLAGCAKQPEQIIGGDKDEHGCLIAAGYSWCDAKQKCIRPFEENCTATECNECPLLSQPAPGFCTDGTIVSGETDECGCQGPPTCETSSNNGGGTQMANPASVYCEEQGGESNIRTAEDGSQSGLCILKNGIECEEWAYFRGECPEKHVCTAEEKAQQACTMEYLPVCGDDGVTYGNKCSACASNSIDSYVNGECPEKTYVSKDPEQCKVIKYLCIKGKEPFSDEFGCGCKPVEDQSTCGNSICDPGEADQCPECYYSTPPCLAPCTAGTCPEDCA
jgi:putative hemolysin